MKKLSLALDKILTKKGLRIYGFDAVDMFWQSRAFDVRRTLGIENRSILYIVRQLWNARHIGALGTKNVRRTRHVRHPWTFGTTRYVRHDWVNWY